MFDIYANVYLLRDYINTYANVRAVIDTNRPGKWRPDFTFEELRKALDQCPIKTVEQHYGPEAPQTTEISEHPAKVARLNHLAKIANDCKSLTVYKQARNEVNRLLYTKDKELPYPEPEFNPDLLHIE